MPALPRRRSDDPHREVWHVYFGDVRVGQIGQRAGVPVGVDQWGWSCGFCPGCQPGEHRDATAPDFFTARRAFEAAWRELSARKTEVDYQEWRDHRDMTARKYAMWARSERLPSQIPSYDAMRLRRQIRQPQARSELRSSRAYLRGASRRPKMVKYIETSPLSDPEPAARKLVEIASGVEAVQDGRIRIEKINGPFLFEIKGTPAQYLAALKHAIERGWIVLHESGTFIRFTVRLAVTSDASIAGS